MRLKGLKIYVVLCFFVFMQCIQAQDIHFSQYYNAPLLLNPAKAGFFMGSHRFGLNYKNQWQSVTNPYRTLSASFDMPVLQRSKHQDMLGAGLVVNTDKAGDAAYATTSVQLSLSYIKALNRMNNQYLAFALQPAFTQKSFDSDKLHFDNQFDGTTYNPDLPQGESFNQTNFMFFDIGAAVYWNYQHSTGLGFDAGLSAFHINQPKQTFFDDPSSILHRKWIFFSNAVIQTGDKYDIVPGIFYARQGNFQETILGATFRYVKSPNPINYSTFNAGLFMRTSDAAIFVAGFDYLRYSLAVSYDVNYSGLKPASRHLGGIELSFKYIIDSKKTYIRKVPCPIF